jgi:hypothetical protein
MKSAFKNEDEGTAHSSAASVIKVISNAKSTFPNVITAHQLARSLQDILKPHGFSSTDSLLTTSFCCDEVCRDLEDELREVFGQNFALGGIAGFPFGGNAAFGAMAHHIPSDGNLIICYGPHVGIDFDGAVGKVNRRGHHGSGTCCNSAIGSLAYVKAVKEGTQQICNPAINDPTDAQQVFVDTMLMEHADRLLEAKNEMIELPHALFDCQEKLLKKIMDKCCPKDIPEGTKIALLGGIQVNTPEGTPEYFMPKQFHLLDSNGVVQKDLIQELVEEGTRDVHKVIMEKRLQAKMDVAKKNLADVPIMEDWEN